MKKNLYDDWAVFEIFAKNPKIFKNFGFFNFVIKSEQGIRHINVMHQNLHNEMQIMNIVRK